LQLTTGGRRLSVTFSIVLPAFGQDEELPVKEFPKIAVLLDDCHYRWTPLSVTSSIVLGQDEELPVTVSKYGQIRCLTLFRDNAMCPEFTPSLKFP
jgi:hypothetical protein